MSKKTRKKSSKSPPARPTEKSRAAKAGTAKRVTAGKPAAKSTAAKAPATGTPRKAPKKPATAPSQTTATLSVGDAAPAFSLPRDGGQLVSLADYAGRKLVIFFYPRANTPGCTLEAIAFSRLAKNFAAAQSAVLGVSADPLKAQESFRDKHDLTVPLISDEALEMLKAYGVWGEKSMYGKTFMGVVRTTVLVDDGGRIARIWRNVKVADHAEEVLTAARAI